VNSLRLGLVVFLAVVVQIAAINRISLFGIRPDLTVLVVVSVALRRGSLTGTLVGFLVGLLQDLLVPSTLGMNMLAKSILGFAAGRLGQNLAVPGLPLYGPLLALAVIFHDWIYLLAYTSLDPGRFLRLFVMRSLPTALYTAVAGVILLLLAAWLGGARLIPRQESGGGR